MSTISLYPKTWAKFQTATIEIMDTLGVLLVSSGYVFDASHTDITDVPATAIVGKASLNSVLVDRTNGVITVGDTTIPAVSLSTGEIAVGIVLYIQDTVDEDNLLLTFSGDATGLPLTASTDSFILSYPAGLLTIDETGYATPDIVITEVSTRSPFDTIIDNDIENCLMNLNEFGRRVIYTHKGSGTKTYNVIKTATPEEVQLEDVDVSSISQTIKIRRTALFHLPKRDDKLIMEGITYIVVGAWLENYTIDIYLQETIG